jgi:trk system potassium uptake protein TrkA
MKAIIIGGGEIGVAIADAVVREESEVYIVERDPVIAHEIQARMDVQVLQGSGCSPSVLKQAHVGEADLIAVVTDSDEDNLCASMLARHYAPGATIIARIRNPELAAETDFLVRSGPKLAHILNPEILAARQIFHAIRIPSAVEVAEFENGRLLLVGVKVPRKSPLAGKEMKDLPKIIHERQILFVARYRENELIIPKGTSGIHADDLLYFICRSEDVRATSIDIGLAWYDVKSVVIVGATVTGIHLAQLMRRSGISVKMIEKDHAPAAAATEKLPDVLVFKAEPTDASLWQEESLAESDALASVCRDEQMNLMVSLLAKKMGIKHTAVITYRSAFIPILLESGITTVVSPRSAAIGSVLKFMRKGRILQVSSTELEDAELLEYQTREGDSISGKKIRDIPFPRGAIVGAVFRNEEVIIPSGEDEVRGGDRVLIFSRKIAVADVEKLMQA